MFVNQINKLVNLICQKYSLSLLLLLPITERKKVTFMDKIFRKKIIYKYFQMNFVGSCMLFTQNYWLTSQNKFNK